MEKPGAKEPAFESCRYKPFYNSGNNKFIMQNLNDRMEVFIKKVQTLNSSNAELQRKTDERSASRTVESCDYSGNDHH